MNETDFFCLMLDKAQLLLAAALPPTISQEQHIKVVGWAKAHYQATTELLGIKLVDTSADNFATAVALFIATRQPM